MITPDFDIGSKAALSSEPDVRPLAFDRPGEEDVHALVDLAAHAGNLAFADALHAERLDQIIDRAGVEMPWMYAS